MVETAARETDWTIHRAAISDITGAGDVEIVAGVAGKIIRVVAILVIVDAAGTIAFEDGAGGTALTGDIPLAANSGFAPGDSFIGHFETITTGAALSCEVGGSITNLAGWLNYQLVEPNIT